MRRSTSAPPGLPAEPEPERAPAWFDEVVSPAASSVRPASADCYATAVHAGPVQLPSGRPLADRHVGVEQAGRYVYTSPDGESGAELGRGGIGRVLVVMDEHLGREVALKELLDVDGGTEVDPELTSRFLAEARITGQLEHPNIVPVYELGRRRGGRLYYAMRVVRGETLSAALERAETLTDRLGLLPHFAGLCNAIAYAHSRGVVHRDIKPDNVMIGEFGETVVLDWGIAKVSGQPDAVGARVPRGVTVMGETHVGDVVGTPLFMSPEQASGRIDEVDESSDVWSLGVVLYQLLCGRLPFVGKTSEEVVQRVVEARLVPVQKREPLAPSELSAVAERALRRDKSERYQSVRDLKADIDAFMSGARVAAYEYSAFELLRRFAHRHRAAAGVALVALISLLVVATLLQRRILSARDRALLAERVALDKERTALSSLSEVFAERALSAVTEGDVVGGELYGARALSLGERPDARGNLIAQTNQTLALPEGEVSGVAQCGLLAATPTGIVACARELEVTVLYPGAGASTWTLEKPARSLVLSGDGRLLLVLPRSGRARLRDARSGGFLGFFPGELGRPDLIGLSRDGSRLALARGSGVRVLSVADGRELASAQLPQRVSAQDFSPDGQQLALGGRLGALSIWRYAVEAPELVQAHRGTVTALSFSPSGAQLASAGSDRSLGLWSSRSKARLAAPLDDVATLHSLSWSPDGRFVLTGGDDRTLGLLDVRDPRHLWRFRRHRAPLVLARFSSPEQMISLTQAGPPSRWRLARPRLPRKLTSRGNVLAQAFAGAGALATAGLGRHGVCLWEISEERCRTTLPVSRGQVRALAVSAGARQLAVGTSEGGVVLWNLETTLPDRVLAGHEAEVRSLEFDVDGRRLLSGARDGSASLWDVRSGERLARYVADAPVNVARFDRGRRRVLLGTRAGRIEAFDLDGRRTRVVSAPSPWIMDIAVHEASDRMSSVGDDGRVAFWSLADLRVLGQAVACEGRCLSVAASSDGNLVATAGEDGVVTLFDPVSQRLRARLTHHRGVARSVRFSPDDAFLASGGDDASVRLWDLSRLTQSGQRVLAEAEARHGVRLAGARLLLPGESASADEP